MICKSNLILLAGVMAFAIGCGRGSSESYESLVPLRDNEISLRVINQNYYDARLFARWRNGRRVSIGNVNGFDERTFAFRWETYDLQVEINLLSVGIHY